MTPPPSTARSTTARSTRIEALDPAEAELVQDDSPHFRRSRLWVEAVLRKTPVPLHEPGLTVSQHMLLDPLDFQRQALDPARLRPRLLLADVLALRGKAGPLWATAALGVVAIGIELLDSPRPV